jgi:hypothetical protein
MPLSVKKKNEVILNSRKIISFCRNGCNLNKSLFNDKEEIIKLIKEIQPYGDISSVRRAIDLYNTNFKENYQYEISENVKEDLSVKKKIKQYSIPSIQIKKGNFRLEF